MCRPSSIAVKEMCDFVTLYIYSALLNSRIYPNLYFLYPMFSSVHPHYLLHVHAPPTSSFKSLPRPLLFPPVSSSTIAKWCYLIQPGPPSGNHHYFNHNICPITTHLIITGVPSSYIYNMPVKTAIWNYCLYFGCYIHRLNSIFLPSSTLPASFKDH